MEKVDRHKVFISYYHKEDQDYKNFLVDPTNYHYYDYDKKAYLSPFDDYSVRDGDIDDTNMTAEQIRRKIRDEYIKDATVLVLLCGKNTKYRKHIDWEIHAAMYDSEINPKMGILIVNLPDTNTFVRACDDDEKRIVSENENWLTFTTREQYEKNYPYMPARIIDNFIKNDVSISVVNWERIEKNPERFIELIDKAFKRRETNNYDHSRPLRKNNS